MNRFIVKLNRTIAWVLAINTIILIITGYRSLGYFQFFTRGSADITHRIYLGISFIVLFASHSLISTRFILMRKHIKGRYIDVILILVGIIFITFFILLAFI